MRRAGVVSFVALDFALGRPTKSFVKDEEREGDEEEQCPQGVDQIHRDPESGDYTQDCEHVKEHETTPEVEVGDIGLQSSATLGEEKEDDCDCTAECQ